MADNIARIVQGRTVDRVDFAFESLAPFQAKLKGRRVEQVSARGKAILVRFAAAGGDPGWIVYSHNQLYGKWRTGITAKPPRTNRQLRLALTVGRRVARLYSASEIRVVAPDQLEQIPYLAKLGPDPLNDPVSDTQLATRCDDRRFTGRRLGALLLEPGFIAGVGNYLRSEILYSAGLPPTARPRELDAVMRRRLIEATRLMLTRAYRHSGVTNDPACATEMKARGIAYRNYRHLVFRRGGEACYSCATPIEEQRVANRRLYHCPRCQSQDR